MTCINTATNRSILVNWKCFESVIATSSSSKQQNALHMLLFALCARRGIAVKRFSLYCTATPITSHTCILHVRQMHAVHKLKYLFDGLRSAWDSRCLLSSLYCVNQKFVYASSWRMLCEKTLKTMRLCIICRARPNKWLIVSSSSTVCWKEFWIY